MPLGMAKAVLEGQTGIFLAAGTIHRLEEEMIEIEMSIALRFGTGLRVNEFQFVPLFNEEPGIGFGTHAHPVHSARYGQGAIGFDGHLEVLIVKGRYCGFIQLQQGFASRADDVGSITRPVVGPEPGNCPGQICRVGIAPTMLPVHTPEVGIAKSADGLVPVLFPAAPQIAAREAAKYGRAARLGTLALKRVEYFLDFVGQKERSLIRFSIHFLKRESSFNFGLHNKLGEQKLL